MNRTKMNDLIEWKNRKNKLPLILLGARQVGKTYLLHEFAGKYYDDYIYINFEKNKEFMEFYDRDLNPERILEEIELYFTKRINPENMLIVFDEIQYCDKALTALKYFSEQLPDYDIVCAGSLLGVMFQREKFSFPVGKVEFHYLYPFTFDEFLDALGSRMLVDKIRSCYIVNEKMPEPLHIKLLDLYRRYLCIGGMPSAINEYLLKDMDILSFDRAVHRNIINAYIADMSKYTNSSDSIKIQAIYKSIPEQLASDSRKFKYSLVEKGGRSSRYGNAVEWLILSLINIECSLINRVEHPLKVFSEKGFFKLYLSDVGLLMSLSGMPFKSIMLESTRHMYKGAVTENYVAQHLKLKNTDLYYWKNNACEVDFLHIIDDEIIPVEVKASHNKRSRSLNEYIKIYDPEYAIRVSANNFGFKNEIKSVPLYAVFMI
jgi:predicted AAA+ superfamily ATPase